MFVTKADGFHEFEGVVVCLDGLNGYQIGGDDFAMSVSNIVNSGGAGAGLIDETMLEVVRDAFQHGEKAVFREQLEVVRPGYVIAMYRDVFKGLTEEEELAVLLHEMGHIRLGHLEDQSVPRNENGMMDCHRVELEADAYAVKRVGKETMASALMKVIRNSLMLRKNFMDANIDIDASFKATMDTERMILRMEALS